MTDSKTWDRVHNRPADIYTPPEDRVDPPEDVHRAALIESIARRMRPTSFMERGEYTRWANRAVTDFEWFTLIPNAMRDAGVLLDDVLALIAPSATHTVTVPRVLLDAHLRAPSPETYAALEAARDAS